MKERKNIDRLFQERFKDFEAHPSPEVWAKIEDRLNLKKKKKVIPLWWKLGGIAALLAILFLAGNLYFAPFSGFPQKNNSQFVTTDSTKTQQEKHIAQPNIEKDSVNNAVVFNTDQENSTNSTNSTNSRNSSKSGENNNKSAVSSSAIVSNKSPNSIKDKSNSSENNVKNEYSTDSVNDAVVFNTDQETSTNSKKSTNSRNSSKSDENNNKPTVSTSEIVSNTESNSTKGKSNSEGNQVQNESFLDSVNDAVVFNTNQTTEKNSENNSKTGEKTNKPTISTSEIVSNTESNSTRGESNSEENQAQNKFSSEVIAENSAKKTAKDTGKNSEKTINNTKNQSLATENRNAAQHSVLQNSEKVMAVNKTEINKEKLSEKNSLTQIVQEEQAANSIEEAIENEKNQTRRWALTPNIAPVYYDSFGGSGISPQFDGNSKEGRVNLSYGLLVSYAINDKLTVRSGLSKIDLSYNTNDAILYTGVQAGTLQSLNFNKQTDLVQVESAVRAYSSPTFSNSGEIPNIKSSEGYVNQSLAYFEVPMEVEYALVENRVGLQLIGGLSTLFLNNNALTFSDNDFKTSLPESTNLNEVSFSTNVGLGLDYKFTDDIKFNLQPMFKYQLNAYKNNVSDFKPYYLGLYTGFSIKF